MCRTRSRSIFRILGGATIALAAGAGLLSCASSAVTSRRTAHLGPQIAADSSVVILRVINYEWYDVAVLLDAGDNPRMRVGTVTGMHWSFFVLTSAVLGGVKEFAVVVVPVGRPVLAYQSNRITRVPGRLVLVTIAMGEDPERATYHRGIVIGSSLP